MKLRFLVSLVLVGVLASIPAHAQGPSPAVVQQAIRALLAGNNTWTGTNTFQAITVTSCTGCGGGGDAPAAATYITQTANATLTNEQAIGALSSGIMRVATTTGVVTALTDSAGIAANISDETGTGALVFATSPTFVTPILGTPQSVTLTNATGMPIAGVTGLGTGVGTWLATPSSANLSTALTDETGSGVAVFATTPTLVTPVLGVATGTSLVNTLNGIGVPDFAPADDGLALKNTTAGTGGVPVQGSPNQRLEGHSFFSAADHLHDVVVALLPGTANGIDNRPGSYVRWMNSTDSGTYYEQMRLSSNGNLLVASGIDAGYCVELNDGRAGVCQGDVTASYNGVFYWRGQSDPTLFRIAMSAPSSGLMKLYGPAAGTRKIELNIGTAAPTVSTCGGSPTVGANATNVAGAVGTGSAATACTLTFGAPAWTSVPICMFTDVTTNPNALLTITAASTTAFTVTVGAAKTVWWHCIGVPAS